MVLVQELTHVLLRGTCRRNRLATSRYSSRYHARAESRSIADGVGDMSSNYDYLTRSSQIIHAGGAALNVRRCHTVKSETKVMVYSLGNTAGAGHFGRGVVKTEKDVKVFLPASPVLPSSFLVDHVHFITSLSLQMSPARGGGVFK